MTIHEYNNNKITIARADEGKYLAKKDNKNSETLIGKPIEIIFDNSGDIPELEERNL